MITTELISFINKEIISGKTKEQIESELLLSGGWSAEDIKESFLNLNGVGSATGKISIYLKIFLYLIFYFPSLVFLFWAAFAVAAGVSLIFLFGIDNFWFYQVLYFCAFLFFLVLSFGLFKLINFVLKSLEQKYYSNIFISIIVILAPFVAGLFFIIRNGPVDTLQFIYETLVMFF